MIHDLNERTRLVFESIVDAYLKGGEPVGSRTLSRLSALGGASPATIRNVMADLVDMGLLASPHVSAGRVPTSRGLRLFIDGMMQVNEVADDDRRAIETRMQSNAPLPQLLNEAVSVLTGLSACAGMVIAPKRENAIKQIQFVSLAPSEILVVLVFQDGMVENRFVKLEEAVSPSILEMASNFLTSRLAGKTLSDARAHLLHEMHEQKAQLDQLTMRVIEAGIAEQSPQDGILIVKGTANLLENVQGLADLEQIRGLMDQLEDRQAMLKLLENTQAGEGMQIFIGAENPLFDTAGLSMIVAPTRDQNNRLIGALGVIGPMHLNYGRIIPLVDYTARMMGRLI